MLERRIGPQQTFDILGIPLPVSCIVRFTGVIDNPQLLTGGLRVNFWTEPDPEAINFTAGESLVIVSRQGLDLPIYVGKSTVSLGGGLFWKQFDLRIEANRAIEALLAIPAPDFQTVTKQGLIVVDSRHGLPPQYSVLLPGIKMGKEFQPDIFYPHATFSSELPQGTSRPSKYYDGRELVDSIVGKGIMPITVILQ